MDPNPIEGKSAATRLDSLLYDRLEEVDPFVDDLIRLEEEQQARKLILVASVSFAPRAVLRALGSVFQNVCAEGYPSARIRLESEERLRDIAWQLASYRRYADRRFYKGVDYVDLLESLAQRRCAELFAPPFIRPENLYVNVQPLSGAVANLAVFQALLKPGDTLMGMDLKQGGHLTHGSKLNLSGQIYHTVSYTVDPVTEKLDYQAIRALARQYRPKLIVAGYTSYPWAPDWNAFRAIADEVGAYLLADIAHTAGLVAAGAHPNPVGIAHVTTLTTNKTLCGPRGAVVMTTHELLAQAIDRAIFPGEQSAPHANQFAAMAVAFHIAQSKIYRELQHRIITNARVLAHALQKCGLRLAYGGTDTHLMVVDLKSVPSRTGFLLFGEPAARILDLAGIVVNKNSLPGDQTTALATGIRLGTSWVTQRGLGEKDMTILAELIYGLLLNIRPFSYQGASALLPRGKIDSVVLENALQGVAELAKKAHTDIVWPSADYRYSALFSENPIATSASLRITGWRARAFIQQIATAQLALLAPGHSALAYLLDQNGQLIDQVAVTREPAASAGQDRYLIAPTPGMAVRVLSWLRGLSDGYLLFDPNDIFRKVEGPVVIESVSGDRTVPCATPGGQTEANGRIPLQAEESRSSAQALELYSAHPECFDLSKPYFIGQSHLQSITLKSKEKWQWPEPALIMKPTPLYELHKALGAKMAGFTAWEMPIWYESIIKEHKQVRSAAGLFDITHMGVFEAGGPHAAAFLDAVFTNYIAWLEDGRSCYGFFLDPDGVIIDDAIIYRLRVDRYLIVVNAANEAKDWDWLNQVNEQRVIIDRNRPWVAIAAPTILQNLRTTPDPHQRKCILALQGPSSLPVLQALTDDAGFRDNLSRVRQGHLIEGELSGRPMIIARTGYTGEEWGFEIFIQPDQVAWLWTKILGTGKAYGVEPAGLAARDSIRTEAGLPLWGKELAGPFHISPLEAGFAGYVKYHKPFFVGRDVLLSQEQNQKRRLIRFRVDKKGIPRPHFGDPLTTLDRQVVGHITSCAVAGDGHFWGLAVSTRADSVPGISLLLHISRETAAQKSLTGRPSLWEVEIKVLTRFRD